MFRSTWYVTRSTRCLTRRTASAAAPASSTVASRKSVRPSSNVRRAPPRPRASAAATRREPPSPGTGAFGRTAESAGTSGAADTSAFPARHERHARERRQVGRREKAVDVRAAVELGKALLVLGLEVVMKVSVEVFVERRLPEPRPLGGHGDDLGQVRLRVFARPQERLRRHGGSYRPHRKHERQPREAMPALREVEDVKAGEV